jgi:hypothetical protein
MEQDSQRHRTEAGAAIDEAKPEDMHRHRIDRHQVLSRTVGEEVCATWRLPFACSMARNAVRGLSTGMRWKPLDVTSMTHNAGAERAHMIAGVRT